MTKTVMTHVHEHIDIDYLTLSEVNEKVLTFARENGVPATDVRFDVGAEGDYGCYYARVYLICERPETDVEKDIRLAKEKEDERRQAEYDARQLQALKKRYPELFK